MSSSPVLKRAVFVLAALLSIGLVAAGCGSSDNSTSGGTSAEGGGGGDFTIALMLPENETPRYETNDRPDFESSVKEMCPGCEVIYFNAGGDAEKQQSQGEAALTKGADVLVLDPMDSKSAATIVERANAQDVPVVSYDRLIENSELDAYVSFDNERVGELQAETLSKKLKEDGHAKGPIIMINGDPADPNAAGFKAGATHRVRHRRRQDRQGIRHPGLERGKRPARGPAGDHGARQGRVLGTSTPPTTTPAAARSRR